MYETKIKLHDTDAAGIIFFANQFKMVHDAYENLLEEFGWSFRTMLKNTSLFLPIVHAESDYLAPVEVGDKITIAITVGRIGETSFSLDYTLRRGKTLIGRAKTVHVTVSRKTQKKVPLPAPLRKALNKSKSSSR